MNRKYIYFLTIIPSLALIIYLSTGGFKHTALPKQFPKDTINYSSDVVGFNGMVVSASKYASETGLDVLKRGGNAVDAAVAVAFVLAVTYPQAGNIGGGGFMVIRTKDNKITTIDFREKAPSAAYSGMYLDADGNYDPDKSQLGHLSSGVPGSVAGLLYALEKYGTMPGEEILDPAINYADNGFEIEPGFAESLNSNFSSFNKFPSTRKIFTKSGSKFKAGDIFVQHDLANTLKLVKFHGRDGFYSGITADLIEKEMKNNGGLITKADLQNYRPVERNPVGTTYKGYTLYSMAPPSSGGICLIELLNMVENDPVPDLNNDKQYSDYIHLLTEAMKRVFADRSEYMGDPDFYDVPVRDLTSKNYAKERRKQIGDTATAASDIKPGLYYYYKESDQTTHYSVIDKDGNMVSVTTTLNNTYGSFVVVDGAGFLLNDEMDDFVAKPGVPNMFGLVGSFANSIQPDKRMLSSMTPAVILKDNQPFMVVGSPGGGKIITSVFLTILNVIDFKLPLNEAVDKPRFHHQWLPEYLQYEGGAFTGEIISDLKSKGHELKNVSDYGSVNAILVDWNNHTYYGHSDRRGYGKAAGY